MKQKVVSGFLMVICFVAGICMLISGLVSLAGKSGYEKTVRPYSLHSAADRGYSFRYCLFWRARIFSPEAFSENRKNKNEVSFADL